MAIRARNSPRARKVCVSCVNCHTISRGRQRAGPTEMKQFLQYKGNCTPAKLRDYLLEVCDPEGHSKKFGLPGRRELLNKINKLRSSLTVNTSGQTMVKYGDQARKLLEARTLEDELKTNYTSYYPSKEEGGTLSLPAAVVCLGLNAFGPAKLKSVSAAKG